MPLFVGSKLFLYNELLSEDGAGAISNYTGITGFLIPPKDPTVLANKIKQLLTNPQLAREFGKEGRKRVIDKFSLRRNVIEISKIIEEVGNSARRKALK